MKSLAFWGSLKANGGEGVYTSDGAAISTIVDSKSGVLDYFDGHSINDAGDVAFHGSFGHYPELYQTIVRFDAASGLPTKIADTSSGSPFQSLDRLSMNNAGQVAFSAELAWGAKVIAAGTGGPPVLVTIPSSTPSGFSHLLDVDVNPGSPGLEVAFWAETSDGETGIFRTRNLLTDTIASSTSQFNSFGRASINDSGKVGFTAELDSGVTGVFIGDVSPTSSLMMTMVEDTGPFDHLDRGGVALSNTGFAFNANLDSTIGSGVFAGNDVVNDKVLFYGDSVPGIPSTVTVVGVGKESLNDRGQLAFGVVFADGRQSIFRADPLGAILGVAVEQGLNAALAMKSDDTAVLVQVVDGMPDPTQLTFDYLFTTATGRLLVNLDGVTLGTIDAPPDQALEFATTTIQVDIPDLFPEPHSTLALEFVLETDSNPSGLLLDNIDFPGLANGDFGTGDLSLWESDASLGGAVGVAIAPPPLPVPEPANIVLLGIGLCILVVSNLRFQRTVSVKTLC